MNIQPACSDRQPEMKTEFSNDQYDSNYPDGAEHHWWFLARSRIVANAIKAFAGPKSSVLEVGCGRGTVVKGLREAGIDCSGVELAKARPILSAEKHIRVGMDAVELPSTERQRYDTILLLDVIEHLSDPAAFLRNLASAFPNLCHVIITVPARQELWSNYDEFYGHFRRYTPEMLEILSSQLGWGLDRKSYFFHLVYLPAWIMARLGISRETRLKPPLGLSKVIHRVISFAIVLDYYLLPRGLAGTSVIGCFHLGGNAARPSSESARQPLNQP